MKLFRLIFILLFTLISSLSFANEFHIVIDPGHGGADLGAVRDSFVESKIALQIAQKIKSLLDKETNVNTTLTRIKNTSLSLKERVQMANDLKADLYVSLHANTSTSSSVNGMEFYFNSISPKPIEAEELLQSKNIFPNNLEVIEKIKNDFRFYEKTEQSLLLTKSLKSRSSDIETKSVIKRADYYVVDHTNMPSALIELGFISNRREAKKLVSEDYQNQLAQMLTRAILDYKEKSDKRSSL